MVSGITKQMTAIRDGIRMAKKLAPTDMLLLPVVKGGAR